MKEDQAKSFKILVVEDDLPSQKAMLFGLEKEGLEVEMAGNGKEGLDKLRRSRFAAVLLDLRIPGGNGYQFLEEKNHDPAIKDIPVIVFSNFSQHQFVERALELGAKGYLVKVHHSIDDIAAQVKICLSGGKCTVD